MKSEVQIDENGATRCSRDPQKFLNGYKVQYQGTSELVEEFSDTLKNMHGMCLDIGCGPGISMKDIILPKLPKDTLLVGADESELMIEYAKKCCEGEKRLSFLHIDIGGMRIPEQEIEKYNNIVSFYYLHTFQNIQRSARNMSRLLAVGGQGLVMFLSHHDVFDLFMEYRCYHDYKKYMEDVFLQLPALYGLPNAADIVKDDLETVGLKPITCVSKELSFTYDSMDELENTLMVMDPFVDRMPNGVREIYTKQITEQFAKNRMKDGKIVDTYRVVMALFEKVGN
ncbi:juvenile hormone acid O-methyltransferase [Diachasma alloeum]|uniref:juvenile hormone acid O-methyltransferase n=1 Tax=Diachasma alloeum TaxID=454923 RepID=UPI0007385070|nr:juvenile hormone acid O-methyltransferase [Diachasma alloeum]